MNITPVSGYIATETKHFENDTLHEGEFYWINGQLSADSNEPEMVLIVISTRFDNKYSVGETPCRRHIILKRSEILNTLELGPTVVVHIPDNWLKLKPTNMNEEKKSQAEVTERMPTKGDKLVRRNFNPSKFPAVDEEKRLAAALIDHIEQHGKDKREASVAITLIQQASMMAVASITSDL
jgi:hypothetical protein